MTSENGCSSRISIACNINSSGDIFLPFWRHSPPGLLTHFFFLKLFLFVPQTWAECNFSNFFTVSICFLFVKIVYMCCAEVDAFFFFFQKAQRQMGNENCWPQALSFWIPQLSRPPPWQLCPAVFRRWGIWEKWNIKSLRRRSSAARSIQVRSKAGRVQCCSCLLLMEPKMA